MKKKIILVLIAIVLIMVVVAVSFGATLIEKYSYSKEQADLDAYFKISSESDVALILHDEMMEERARLIDGTYYFDLATVHKYFNERFYVDKNENILLYTLPDAIIRNEIGTGFVSGGGGDENYDYAVSIYKEETLYIAVDYVKKYTNFSYQTFTAPNRMQLELSWEDREKAQIKKDTAVRVLGGIKSEILADVSKDDSVYILEQMETWSKVKTGDAIIGYVENKMLSELTTESPIPVTDYEEPVYTSVTRDHKINLGWHVVAGIAGNDTIYEATASTKDLNVISPTWFKLSDNEGNFVSLATQQYVDTAHGMGLEVWALLENIEYKSSLDMYTMLSSTTTRARLIDNLINEVLGYGIDGINVDLEEINVDTGEHFIQFIRELSIPCRENGIVLSIDNYVPYNFNDHYNRKEQGIVADYVIIMGYDEHYAGSDTAGSVASIDYVENGIARTIDQVPAHKVINAVPFYTRIWETTGTSVSSQAVGMELARQWIDNHSIETYWDETTCQNYGEYSADNTLHQVWLEDADSILVKLNIMHKYEIGGIAGWRLGYETPAVWEVISEYLAW